MIAQQICVPDHVNAAAQTGCCDTHCPPTRPSISSTTPISDASTTLPGRTCFIHQPMRNAMGIVVAIVNRPHGLPRSALTTTSASTASRMIMIARIATIAASPATGFDFLFRHLAERLAVAADRGNQDREVLHGAAQHDAEDQPERPRQKAELRGQRGPDQRARARDRREVMAVGDPAVRRMEIAPVVEPFGGRRPLAVQREDLRRDESPVEPVRDQVRADAGDRESRPR